MSILKIQPHMFKGIGKCERRGVAGSRAPHFTKWGTSGFLPSLTSEQTFEIINIFLQDAYMYFSNFVTQLVSIAFRLLVPFYPWNCAFFSILWSFTFKHYPITWISHHGEMRILSSKLFFIISM